MDGVNERVARLASGCLPRPRLFMADEARRRHLLRAPSGYGKSVAMAQFWANRRQGGAYVAWRSEEHTSEIQSLMRTSYAVFLLKKKKAQAVMIVYTNVVLTKKYVKNTLYKYISTNIISNRSAPSVT